jgi:SOS response regulatory protein OraA/RecX
MPMREAYLKAFPTNDERYALSQAKTITKTERIRTAMKKELEPIINELGITPEYVLGVIKDIAEVSERDETRLKAVTKLSDILDLEDKNTTRVTQLTGAIFQGFSEEQIDKASRPLEIENESKS